MTLQADLDALDRKLPPTDSSLDQVVRRYTTLSSALDTLANKRIVLRDPSHWDDTNDSYFLELYKLESATPSVVAVCCTRATEKAKAFDFPFAGLEPSPYRLTKGALYPIFAAFRNALHVDSDGFVRWTGGFHAVRDLWRNVAPELAKQTKQAIKDYGHKPDAIGKNRGHWTNMHQTVELHILRQRMKDTGGKVAA